MGEILDMIKKDNVADLKDAINTDLHDRIKQSIELKKVEVAKDLASKPKPEEKQAVTEPVEEPEAA